MFDAEALKNYVRMKLCSPQLPYSAHAYQTLVLEEVIEAYAKGFKNVIIIAPTGSGKSLLGVGLAMAFNSLGLSAFYITPLKLLQDQVFRDFKDHVPIKILKGKANYTCAMYLRKFEKTEESYKCTEAPCVTQEKPNPQDFRTDDYWEHPIETAHADQDGRIVENASELATTWQSDAQLAAAVEKDFFTDKWQRKLCADNDVCSYYMARNVASASKLCLMNLPLYLTWNTICRGAEMFLPRHLNIFDECHNIENSARDMFTAAWSEDHLGRVFSAGSNNVIYCNFRKTADLPADAQVNDFKPAHCAKIVRVLAAQAKQYLTEHAASLGFTLKDYLTVREASDGESTPTDRLVKVYTVLTKADEFFDKYAVSITDRDGDGKKLWGNKLRISIVNVDLPPDVKNIYGERNLFMSATVPDVDTFCKSILIERKETYVINMANRFPRKNRPIFMDAVANVTRDNLAADADGIYQKLAAKIDEITAHFPTVKGIVHTGSYLMNEELTKWLKHKDRYIIAQKGENEAAVAEHTESSKPTILISPAIREGYDFKNKLGRIQVIAKCPYLHFGDPIVIKKTKTDRNWALAGTATHIMQMYGRCIRNENDFALTILIDGQLEKFIWQTRRFFPQHFHAAMVTQPHADWRRVRVDGDELSYDK